MKLHLLFLLLFLTAALDGIFRDTRQFYKSRFPQVIAVKDLPFIKFWKEIPSKLIPKKIFLRLTNINILKFRVSYLVWLFFNFSNTLYYRLYPVINTHQHPLVLWFIVTLKLQRSVSNRIMLQSQRKWLFRFLFCHTHLQSLFHFEKNI